jgi:hypothetical protein
MIIIPTAEEDLEEAKMMIVITVGGVGGMIWERKER